MQLYRTSDREVIRKPGTRGVRIAALLGLGFCVLSSVRIFQYLIFSHCIIDLNQI